MVGRELDEYRLNRFLGSGAMGRVYEAEHVLLRKRRAIKILRAEVAENEASRERFLREPRLASAIDHPNIVDVYDAGEADGVSYIAMRYVNEDLSRVLRREGNLDIQQTLSIARQVGAALDAAHGHGLVHRDVKPANVLLDDQNVYLSDFGLAIDANTPRLTRQGFFVGTSAYASPEQINAELVDGRADLYSLACVLYECLTGTIPFERDAEVQIQVAHLREPPPAPSRIRPDLPRELDDVFAKGMAKMRHDRHSCCLEFINAIAVACEANAQRIRPAPISARPFPPAPAATEGGSRPERRLESGLAQRLQTASAPKHAYRHHFGTPVIALGSFLLAAVLTLVFIFALNGVLG